MVDGLRRALGFLTVYPLRASDAWTPETLGSSMVYYPLIGTFIGLALWDWRCYLAYSSHRQWSMFYY